MSFGRLRLVFLIAVAILAFSVALVASAAPSAPAAARIAAGHNHTCALTSKGGIKCWGYNFYGQLGNGKRSLSSPPVGVVRLPSGVSAIAAGSVHACAVTRGGGAKCWGQNTLGQLGNGARPNSSTPVNVVGLTSGVKAIAAGGDPTCAITSGGGVKCWGRNGGGELGNGTRVLSRTPVDVVGIASGVTAIAAGNDHTCAITGGGGVKCWGWNSDGQLGNGSQVFSDIPADVAGLTSGVSAIAAGWSFTCAVTSGGGAKCWGSNFHGQLGNGSRTVYAVTTPVDVAGLGSGVSAISAGRAHACALTRAGGVKCWGNNVYGKLGNGSRTDRSTPVNVAGLTSGVSAIAAGASHTCALMRGGGAKCWGATNGAYGREPFNTKPVDVPLSARSG